jgi:hypothetical protein
MVEVGAELLGGREKPQGIMFWPGAPSAIAIIIFKSAAENDLWRFVLSPETIRLLSYVESCTPKGKSRLLGGNESGSILFVD